MQQFLEHIKDIYIVAFLKNICRDINQRILDLELLTNGYQLVATLFSVYILSFTTNNQVPQSGNVEFFNYIWFLQVINTYKLLKYAIKHINIGLLNHIIPRFCLYFAGSLLKNYIYNMLLLWRLVRTSACDLVL